MLKITSLICAVYLLFPLSTVVDASTNVHRHGHLQQQTTTPYEPTDEPTDEATNYLDMVMLHNANANCGTGCYKIKRHQVAEISRSWEIFRVDIQFFDPGPYSGPDQFTNDQFEVTRIQPDVPPTLLERFNVKAYDFYAKGLRATQITESILDWLYNSSLPYFYIKFSKVGDTFPETMRFASHPTNKPILILLLNGSSIVRRRRSIPSVSRSYCSDDGELTCCLRNKTVTSPSSLKFLDLPVHFQVAVCEGACMQNPAGDPLQQAISSQLCCQGIRRDRGDSSLTYSDGSEPTRFRVLIQDTSCRCR